VHPAEEFSARFFRALNFADHAGCRVENPAGQAELGGEPVQRGAKTHALHDSGEIAPRADFARLCQGTGLYQPEAGSRRLSVLSRQQDITGDGNNP